MREPALSVAEIIEPASVEQLNQVRALMRAFVEWSRQRYAAYIDQVNAYFEAKAFNAELDGLPGAYARPLGRLLLAQIDGQPAGCVAFRPFDASGCEMKRMFVAPAFQGRGAGRALAERLIAEARASGYARMLLDTGFLQVEAQNLYHSLGFVDIEPYYPIPDAARSTALFMELRLDR
ncbi:MAG TPA: GNAT family N-acetyltransferase [Kouleothrix sp.]|uniref:GNAT family N-acetyltransferase n=1 Tax=Kouleothrix sp. TaxID=2779161 RepID=UPI002CB1089C|nr:GNAT family N-acetyltransferase [Kouleothrix sp.]HRC75619.1 GNAT family N-acetyltransferase [Kouleothrix sp.]